MRRDLEERIAQVAADREAGASAIVGRAIVILQDARAAGDDQVVAAARGLCRAQPAMAPVWNAAIAALASRTDPERLTRFAAQVARAPAAMARFAVDLFATAAGTSAPLRVVTISSSGTVLRILEALARVRPVEVACAEGRPALEGRELASRLARLGIATTLFGDAALAHGLEGSEAVLAGADAVTPTAVINKSGTRMLAATAGIAGVPVYVAAGRDKYVGAAVADRLSLREGPAAEVWDGAPAGIAVRNPYFERVPLELISAIISDFGVIGVGSVAEVCRAQLSSTSELLDFI